MRYLSKYVCELSALYDMHLMPEVDRTVRRCPARSPEIDLDDQGPSAVSKEIGGKFRLDALAKARILRYDVPHVAYS